MQFERWKKLNVDKQKPEILDLGPMLFEGDSDSLKLGVEVVDGSGNPVEVTGSVGGRAIIPTGETVTPFESGKNANRAWVIVPQAALVAQGKIEIFLRVTEDETTTVLLYAYGYVKRTQTTTTVNPGTPIPNVEELGEAAAAANEAAEAATAAASHAVRYDEAQTLTDTQKETARDNIEAASEDDVADLRGAASVTMESDAEDVDLDISDKDGNVILRIKSGHIYTKEFSSDSLDPGNNVPKVSASDATGVDLDVSDKYGNVIVRFKDGHIQTKEFDSETVVSAISILTDTVKKITDGYEELTASITYNASTTNTITITDSFVKGEEIWFHLEDGLEYWDYGQYASYYEGNTLFANNRRGTNGYFRHIVNADCSSVKITIPSNEYTNGTNLTLHVYRITGKIEPKVVTVKADGTGMFTTIRAAIDSITDANHLVNPYVIEVYPGTYNTLAGYSDEEIEAAGEVEHYTQTSMVGPKLTDGMSMRGVGRPDEIILTAELDPGTWSFEVRSEISTLNIQGEGNLENMTIIGKYIRYCVHDDFRAPVNSLDKRVLRNLIFKGTNLSYYPFMTTYGGGMSQPRDYLIENCDFGYDLGIHSNSGYAYGCTIEVNHCSGCRFRIGDAASASGDAVNRVIVNDCNFQVIKIAHNDLTIPSHMVVMGTGNEQSMVKDDTGTMYRLGMIDLFPAGQTAGLMVKRASSGLGIEATSDSDVALGIVIGSDSDYSYVQRCGYIASNYLGLTGLAVGDYVTVDSSTHLVTAGGTSSNAVGVVKAVDSDGIAYIQLTLKGE